MKTLKRLLILFNVAVGAVALYEQLQRSPGEPTWHGTALGVVPYDFRPPSPRRFMASWWNPEDPRLFTPRDFGIGWAINLNRLYRMLSSHDDEQTEGVAED